MKILHLIQKEQNRGAETFACQLANHQKNYGHEIVIVSIFKGASKLDWNGEIINLNANSRNRFLDFNSWKKLNDIITKFNPDILQANAGDTLKYAVFSKFFFKWKTPIVFRNASEVGKYIKSGFQKKFNSFLYSKVDQVISVSKASKKDLVSQFPFLEEMVFVIPIGIEQKKIDFINLKPKSKKHIIHVGGFTFEKNHQGLISIFKHLKEIEPSVHLHLLGDGPLRKTIEKMVLDHNLKNEVTFYGFVKNPLDYIKSGNVLVLPSIIEGLPGVILESMYCKTPVVAYDVGGISEILNPKTGAIINAGDESAFINAIHIALEENTTNTNENAFELVKTNFLNSKIALEFIERYNQLDKS